MCAHARDCSDSILVLCFVMGFVLQLGEIPHNRVDFHCDLIAFFSNFVGVAKPMTLLTCCT